MKDKIIKLIRSLKAIGPVRITSNKSYYIPLKAGHSPVDVHSLTALAEAVNPLLQVEYSPNGTINRTSGVAYAPSLFVGLPNSASDAELEALASEFSTSV